MISGIIINTFENQANLNIISNVITNNIYMSSLSLFILYIQVRAARGGGSGVFQIFPKDFSKYKKI